MTAKKFAIEAQVNAWVSIAMTAESWEDALAKSKKLGAGDFIRARAGGEVIDWTVTIGAVRSSDVPDLYRDP